MLATSHQQRAKIRRNGDHRSPRRLKKKGSYSEKTYQKSQSVQVSNSTFAYFGRIQWKLAQLLEHRTYPRVDLSFKSKLLDYQPKDQGNLLDISLLGRSLHCPTIWWCADKIYPGKRFDKYAILGDDICIADSKVAEVYLSTLKDLGVTISLPKSLVSDVSIEDFIQAPVVTTRSFQRVKSFHFWPVSVWSVPRWSCWVCFWSSWTFFVGREWEPLWCWGCGSSRTVAGRP